MTETYGDVGCDGADEDMAKLMTCWYVDRSSDAPPMSGRSRDAYLMGAACAAGLIVWIATHCLI